MIAPNPRGPMVAAGALVGAVVAAAAGFWIGQGPAPAAQSGVAGTRPTEVGAPLLVQAGKLPKTAPVPGNPQLVAVKVRKPAKKKPAAKKASTPKKAAAAAPAVSVPRPRVVAPAPVQRPTQSSSKPSTSKRSTSKPKSSGSGSSGSGSGSGGDSGSGSGGGGSD